MNKKANINLVTDTTWGDSGKGKLVDYLARNVDMVLRYSGGPNAGHTVINDKGEFKLHVVPSGIFNPRVLNVITQGVVINPTLLVVEIKSLRERKIEVSSKNLLISSHAHLIMPWHILRDGLDEVARGGRNLGTTKQGIGPSYSDRTAREGLRVNDLFLPKEKLEKKVVSEYIWQSRLIRLMSGEKLLSDLDKTQIRNLTTKKLLEIHKKAQQIIPVDIKKLLAQLKEVSNLLRPMAGDTLKAIWKYWESGKSILGEGAQGALLDLDLGGYPFVTSSNPGLAGFLRTTGLFRNIQNVYGVTKAYSTRVGSGPMPTELKDSSGNHIQTVGKEVGTTTGRKRRCGWLDTLAVSYGAKISGSTALAIMKLDVLDELSEIKLAVGYKIGKKVVKYITDPSIIEYAKPVYETFSGWKVPTTGITSFANLPLNARKYLLRIETVVGLPIKFISVGAGREATIVRSLKK